MITPETGTRTNTSCLYISKPRHHVVQARRLSESPARRKNIYLCWKSMLLQKPPSVKLDSAMNLVFPFDTVRCWAGHNSKHLTFHTLLHGAPLGWLTKNDLWVCWLPHPPRPAQFHVGSIVMVLFCHKRSHMRFCWWSESYNMVRVRRSNLHRRRPGSITGEWCWRFIYIHYIIVEGNIGWTSGTMWYLK